MQVTGDRTTPHGLATTGWDDEGVQTQEWDIVRDGVLVGYQLDRRMARQNAAALGVSASNGCAFADSPSHVPVQRMANVSLQPAPDGPSTEQLIAGVERGIYVVGDKSWSIDMQRYNFQFTGQRLLRDPRRPARRTAARRRLPGDDDRLLGLPGGGRRPADLRARRRLQLRQGPAGADRRRVARLPDVAVPRRAGPEHHAGGRPMSTAAQTPGAGSSSGRWRCRGRTACIVLVEESSSANLRWAGSTLTTNGAVRGRSVVVISVVGESVGVRSATVVDDLEGLVRASEAAAREAGPAEDAGRSSRAGRGRLRDGAVETPPDVFAGLARELGRRLRRGPRDGLALYGYASHDTTTLWLGLVDRPAAAPRAADRLRRADRQEQRRLVVGRASTPATGATSPCPSLDAEVRRRLAGAPARSSCRRPLRDAAAAVGRRRPHGLRLLDRVRAAAPRRAARSSAPRRRHPRRRAPRPGRACG
jgi:hypothetical protein